MAASARRAFTSASTSVSVAFSCCFWTHSLSFPRLSFAVYRCRDRLGAHGGYVRARAAFELLEVLEENESDAYSNTC